MLGDWQRTDFTPPSTQVKPLPALGSPNGVWLEWSHSDRGGSGVVGYELEARIRGAGSGTRTTI